MNIKDDRNLSDKQIRQSWRLLSKSCVVIQCFVIQNLADLFNQTLLADDDAFITLWVSTLSGISQMTSRFVYGTLLDVLPFSLLVGVQSLILGTGFVFFYPVALLGEVPYVLWLHLIYITFPGIYAILPGED